VREVLGHFQARVQAQVILSDYDADYKLEGLGLGEYFDRAYSGERIGSFKPNSVPFSRILEDYGIEPEHLLHIGDRVDTDGAGAAATGCPSLVLLKDFRSFGHLYTMLASNSHTASSDSLRGIG
jgi:putative hydrolase of the HAD superfamily